jgi:RNA polymerase sigma-70 factor (ECF subfamily)
MQATAELFRPVPAPRAGARPTMTPDRARDLDLLHALQRGDDTALNLLIGRWEGRLFSFAWRYTRNATDAQDLVAETFVRLYHQSSRLHGDTNLSAWLYTTLSNLCHNQHRWRRRHPTVSFDATTPDGTAVVPAPASDAAHAAEGLEREEAAAIVSAAIDQLPHDLRLTVMLHYFEQLSYREIGDITGCSERGVETRLYRARQQLREALGAKAGLGG